MKGRYAGFVVAILLGIVVVFMNRADVQLAAQDNFVLHKISAGGYSLNWVMHFNNPNLLSSTIDTISEQVFIDGKLVGELNPDLNSGQGIPGRKITDFPVGIRFGLDSGEHTFDTLNVSAAGHSVDVTGLVTFKNLTGGGSIKVDLKQATIELK